MKYSIYSDAGRKKLINEDAYLLRTAICGTHMRGMAAVADGVSSLDDGQFASYFVIAGVSAIFEEWKLHEIEITKSIMELHLALCRKGKQDHKRYGTTLSLFLFEDDHYRLVQIGDSRIYLYQDQVKQLSKDQTLAQEKYDNHTISLEEYQKSRERHVLTQCLGISRDLHIKECQGEWRKQDVVLVCSDGVSNRLSYQTLHAYMESFRQSSAQDCAKLLAWEARNAGESDNQSAILFTRKSAVNETLSQN